MKPQDYRTKFLRSALSTIGCPYIWAGKGDYVINTNDGTVQGSPIVEGRRLLVFDCSGLVTWSVLMAGGKDFRARMYTGDMLKLAATENPEPGDLALYKGHVEIVVTTVEKNIMTVGASGGTSKTTTIPLARASQAMVSVKATHLHRRDFLGFRKLDGLFTA